MPSMNSKVKHIRDEDPAVELRAPGLAAATASGNGAALDLGKLTEAYWDNGELPWSTIAAQVVVSDADFADTDETYELTLAISNDGFVTSENVSRALVSKIGGYVMAFDADTATDINEATEVRLSHTLGGTSPSITFHAWLVHLPQAS